MVDFKQNLMGLKSNFSLTSCHTKVEKHSLLYNLPIAEEGIVRFMPFASVSV